jgi:hypothetical protein
MDLGFEPTIGAGMASGSKTYRKRGCGQIAAMPPPENLGEYPQVGAGRSGGAFPQMNFEQPLYRDEIRKQPSYTAEMKYGTKRVVGGKKATKKGRGTKELKEDVGKFDFNRIKDWIGLAKPPAEMKKAVGKLMTQVELERLPTKNKNRVVEKSQMASVRGGGKSAGGKSGGADCRKKRAEIVKKVMKEKGLKMIEASKFVKANGLY